MIRRYQRFLAAAMCAVMSASMPVTVLAAEPEVSPDLGEAIASVIAAQDKPVIQSSALAPDFVNQLLPDTSIAGDFLRTGETPTSEETDSDTISENTVRIVFNQQLMDLEHEARSFDGVTWVPVWDFFEALGCTVTAGAPGGPIRITRGAELDMELKPDSRLARANGRCWYMAKACTKVDGIYMLPVRDAAKVFSGEVDWDSMIQTAFITGGPILENGQTYYDQEDLLWLARIIRCESGNQPLDGKVAVANVVVNRMNDAGFPSTAEDVIFDRRHGVQFSPSKSQKIYKDPPAECWLAAKLALEGYETAPGCFYFTNAGRAARSWAGQNRPYYATIGDHAFFR